MGNNDKPSDRQEMTPEELKRSRDEIEAILRGIIDGITAQDPFGRLIYANDSAARIIGYPSAQALIEAPIAEIMQRFELFDEEGREISLDDLPGRRALLGEEHPEMLLRFRIRETQEEHWSIVKATPVFDAEGKVRFAINIFRDITEQKRAEQIRIGTEHALRESEQRYRIVAESASDAIITIDEKSTILYINSAGEKIFGYTIEEMLGKNLDMLMPEYLRNLHHHGIARYIATGERHIHWSRVEMPGRHRSGREIPLELSFGESIGGGKRLFTGIVRDISDRRAADQRLKFLAEASEVLASSLDYQVTLSSVTHMAVPHIADWCAVDMLADDGSIERLAVAHVDPAMVEWAHEMQRRFPVDMNAPTGLPNVLRTGKSEFYPEISEEMLVASIKNPQQLEIMRKVGFTSGMVVPLVVQGEVIGGITFVTTESGRRYTESDLALAEDLARRASIAIDNAQLHTLVQEQREWLSVTLSSIGDAVIATDAAGHVTFMNPVAQTLTGWTIDEAQGRELPEVFPIINEQTRIAVENPVEKVLRTGFIIGLANHTVLIARDGTEVPIDDSAAPIRDVNGAMIGVVMVFHDITERRRAERERAVILMREQEARAEAEANERRYRELAEAMPQIVWSADTDGRIIYQNQRWHTYTGIPVDEERNSAWRKSLHPEEASTVAEQWEQAVRSGNRFEIECRIRRHDGAYRWHLARAIPICADDGSVLQWIGTATDIDDRKHAEMQLQFLAETSEVLASSLDYQVTLSSVTHMAVPHIADWCAVDMLADDGSIERLAVAHVDPAMVEWAHEMQRRFPVDMSAPTGLPNVLRTGKSEFYPEISEEMLVASIKNPEQLEIALKLGFTSVMVVPLVVQGEVIGGITFVTAESGRRYTESDLALAEDLARRASIAIDNAQLYETSQEEIAVRTRTEEELRISERRFRTMIEQSPFAIQIFSREGDIINANDSWETLWDTSRSQLVGYNILHDPQLEAKGVLPYIRRVFEGETIEIPPILYDPAEIGRKGRPRWVRAFFYPVTEENGEVREMVLMLEDITEERWTEEALRESEARFRTMADSAPVLIWTAGPDGRFTYVNQTWLEFTGRSLDEELGDGWSAMIHPDEQERCIDTYYTAFRTQKKFQIEYRLRNRNESYCWMLDTGVPRFSRDGEFAGFIGSCIDITGRKEGEIELTKAKEAAEAASQAKDRFLAVLSHELRTPLTPVLTLTQALKEDDLPPDIRAFVEIIDRNVELEARLIDDLLDLTRIEKGKIQLNIETVDAHVLISNVLEIYHGDIEEKGLRLTLDLRAKEHHVRADSARLQQIFWNIVKNAVKFTPQGGTITIRSDNSDGDIHVEVTDTGMGIEPEVMPQIFTAFEQGDQRITRRFGGLGLGLAISKALVDMHGGRLTARSDGRDRGATFTIELPTTKPGSPPTIDNGHETSTSVSREGKSILLVDDHEDTSNVMRTLLERRGYRVTTAATMRQGIDAALAGTFDLLISDIGLPDGSGLELMGELRERGITLEGIALSGFGMEEDIRRSKEAGFVDHLTKPISFQKLQEIIEKLLAKSTK